jgi:hypothetical protein
MCSLVLNLVPGIVSGTNVVNSLHNCTYSETSLTKNRNDIKRREV